MFKNHFSETVVVVLSIAMGFIMSLACIVVDRLPFHFPNVFKLWAMITLVILLASIVIPYKDWSAQFTALFPVEKGSVPYKMIDNILPSLILNTCNTVIVSAANVFYNEAIPRKCKRATRYKGLFMIGQLCL